MLTSIRTTFSRGIARAVLAVLMLLLIASFGLWGIQDVFRGFHSTDVATIGSTSISTDGFQRIYNRQLQQISQRAGTTITAQQARAFGLDRQILNRMIGDAALDEQAKGYGLALAPTEVAGMVTRDPSFKNPATGQFDRQAFGDMLRQAGMSEARFFADQENVYRRAQLGEALAGDAVVPATLTAALTRFSDETRGIAYLTVTRDQIGAIGQPDPAALASFYGEHKSDFRAPELRRFTYMTLNPDEVAKTIQVGDDDLRKAYDAQKDTLGTPEKRTIQRIPFPNEADAKAAADRIAAGKATFEAIAGERGLKPGDLDFGTVTRGEMGDPALADAAFTLPSGGTSGVVQGRLSTVILKVTAVQPGTVPSFDQAKGQLRQQIAADRARQQVLDLEGKIEDARAGGSTLAEIAPKFGLKTREIGAMDATGQDAAGQAYDLPLKDQLAKAVFASEPGADNDVLDGRDQGFVWYDVVAITPARDRTLDEAKAAVTTAWQDAEASRRVTDRADGLVKALRGGKSLDALAGENGLPVKQAWNLKRGEAGQGLSDSAIATVFATPKSACGSTLTGQNADRAVFQVTDVTVPDFDAKADAAKELADRLQAQRSQELLQAYTTHSVDQLGVQVNPQALARATGAGGDT